MPVRPGARMRGVTLARMRGVTLSVVPLAAVAVGVWGLPAAAAVAADPSGGHFRAVPVPVPTDVESKLMHVVREGNGAWAAGDQATSATGQVPLVMRFSAGRWASSPVADPAPGGESARWIAAAGADDRWLADTTNDATSVLRRWNGSAWVRQDPGLTGSDGNPLRIDRVFAHDHRAWASGQATFGDTQRARVATWSASTGRWTYLPEVGYPYLEIYDLQATGPNDVWALGDADTGTVIEQWNGTSWVHRLPAGMDFNGFRLKVVSPTDVWAWGDSFAQPGAAVLLHWDGTSWSEHITAAGADGYGGLAVTADGAVWIAAIGDVPDRAAYLRWNGTSFERVEGPVRRNGVYVQTWDMTVLPGRAEPLVVGQSAVLGQQSIAMSDLRRPSGGAS